MQRARFLFWFDLVLLVLVVLLQAPRPTGLAAHEWLGIAIAPLLALHLLVNWRWIVKTLHRLRANTRRARINAALNGLLYLDFVLALVSGIVISEVALPLTGLEPSDLAAWHQLHAFFSNTSIWIVGLHLGLNWDWVLNVVRKWRAPRNAEPLHTLPQRLDLADAGSLIARLVRLGAVTALLCGAMLFVVDRTATAKERRRGRRDQAARLEAIPVEASLELLAVAAMVIVGRRVLKLKL